MSRENPLWGAPRIYRELLTLGIEVTQSTVAKYVDRSERPTSQGWKTFLRNHYRSHLVHRPIRGALHLVQAALRPS